ncbi:hypothetical protein GCM10027186_57680 [Micromonospora schwarzwaldensis]
MSRAHVEAFQAWMIESRSASTAVNKHKGLQQFFKWLLVDEGSAGAVRAEDCPGEQTGSRTFGSDVRRGRRVGGHYWVTGSHGPSSDREAGRTTTSTCVTRDRALAP